MRLARPASLALAGAALLLSAAAAADETANARALYDQGSAAYNAGDFARAAALLADADAAQPNPLVLGLAIGASLEADDAVLGEDLALRADARGATGKLADLVVKAHGKFQAKVGRVRIVCREGHACVAHLGSMHWGGGELHAVAPGILDMVFDGSPAHVRIMVNAGKVADLLQPVPARALPPPEATTEPAPPPEEPKTEPPPSGGGLSPAVFWTGFAITAGLGIATGIAGGITASDHSTFEMTPSQANANAGTSAQTATNGLLVATAVSAAITLTIGVFFTHWHDPKPKPPALAGTFVF
jgi:hypothetical protein